MRRPNSIIAYGIHLVAMTEADIEQVRLWRNADHVRGKMEFQTPITPEMQAHWWATLDPVHNQYYLIHRQEMSVGVIHAKDIDWGEGVAETGIFIGEAKLLGSFIPVCAVLALMDHLFHVQGLQRLQAKVKADEAATVKFNQQLGYQTIDQSNGFLRMQVTHAEYATASAVLREMADNLTREK